jgi:tRNA(Arg) A34 adenosine deaminase TadA
MLLPAVSDSRQLSILSQQEKQVYIYLLIFLIAERMFHDFTQGRSLPLKTASSMAKPTSFSPSPPSVLISILLQTVEHNIIPLTRQGVSDGSKLFGAAIFSRSTLAPLTVATNNERISPLLHGEINCIQQFFTSTFPDPMNRPDPRQDCIFLATHEPCSLCLSGIAWSGFREVYYLFTYEDSRDLFSIPYDIEILKEVFSVREVMEGEEGAGVERKEIDEKRPLYNRTNKFFDAKSLVKLAADITDEEERRRLMTEIERVKSLYESLSETYQEGKKVGAVSSSILK